MYPAYTFHFPYHIYPIYSSLYRIHINSDGWSVCVFITYFLLGVFSSFVFSFIGPFAVSCLPFRSAVRFVVVVVRGALGRRLCRWGVGWCVLEWVFFLSCAVFASSRWCRDVGSSRCFSFCLFVFLFVWCYVSWRCVCRVLLYCSCDVVYPVFVVSCLFVWRFV